MNEDFLNIWVVLHDKTSAGLKGISHEIQSAEDRIKNLESSMKKMDTQQVKSSNNFLNLGKNIRNATDNVNQMANSLRRHEDATKRINEAQAKTNDLLDKSIGRWSKQKAVVDESNQTFKHFEQSVGRLNTQSEKLVKNLSRTAEQGDRNNKVMGSLSRGIEALKDHMDKVNRSSNTFYVRILGLRLSLLSVAAVLPAAIGGFVQLGAALIAVANAAALAGAALGGALIASIAQATPVVGLLIIAFKQLFDVIKLSGQQSKNAGKAAQDAADKSLALKRRLEDERLAHLALADAQKRLVEARRDALRNIEDLNAAEKESLINSQRATLGLIGAQSALTGLVSGGGSALDVAGAQLDVQDARNGVSAAALTAGRASSDAARARRQGVGGNPNVVSAQQAIIAQQHAMALAATEFAAQQKKTNVTLDDYAKKLAALDPAQRKLFDAVVALRKEWKEEWSGITDPIINSFTGIIKGITKALKDTDIQNAFKGLSGATGSAVTDATSFFGTPEAKKLFLQVIKDAKDNLPLISRILRDISVIFLRVAVAAGPFVHDILKGIRDFFDDLEVKTRDSSKLSGFFTEAFKAADAFWKVFTGILDIFVALGEGGATKTGVDLVGQFAGYLHGIADELRGNPDGVKKFFGGVQDTMGDLGTLLDHLLRVFIKIGETGAFDTIIKLLDKFVLPLLETVLVTAGKIVTALGNFALAHPELIKTAAVVTGVFLAVYEVLKFALLAGKAMVTLGIVSAASMGPALLVFGAVVIAIAAIGIAIYLLDKKFHFLAPTFKWLKDTFNDVIEFVSKHWRGLLILLTGPLGLVIVTIVNHFDSIRKAAVDLKNKMEPIFGFIVDHIVKPLYDHGLKPILDVLLDIINFFDKNDLVDIFGGAFQKVVDIVSDLIGKLQTAYGVLENIATLGGIIGGGSGAGNGSVKNSNGGFKGAGTAGGGVSGALGRNPLQQGGGGSGGGGFLTSSGAIIPDSASGRLPTSNSGDEDVTPTTASGNSGKAKTLADRAQAIADVMDEMPRTDTKGKRIRGYPYAWGGGHGSIGKPSKAFSKTNKITGGYEVGFDCSGAVSAVLGSIGALNSPLDSGGLAGWGVPAQGDEPIIVYANKGHAFIVINGITYTTGAGEDNSFGKGSYGTSGFAARTLPGFADGGWVDGTGTGDSVPAMLTPGELVLTKAHQMMLGGTTFLKKILKFAPGGAVPSPIVRPASGVIESHGGRDQSVPRASLISKGYNELIKSFTALDQVFTDQARKLNQLIQRQKTKLISRYVVTGTGRNTVAIDTGNDVSDAQRMVEDLGAQRNMVSSQLNEAGNDVAGIQKRLRNTPNTKAYAKTRTLLQSQIAHYQEIQANLQEQINQNTLDLVAAQTNLLQATIDSVTSYTNLMMNYYGSLISIANLTGVGKGSIPQLITNQIVTLMNQEGALGAALAQAEAQGNTALATTIKDSINSLNVQIAQLAQDRFDTAIALVEDPANRQLAANDRTSRVNSLGGNSFNSLNRQGGVLNQRGGILGQERAGLAALLPYVMNPAQANELNDKIADLDVEIAENSDAVRENTENIRQANVDRIKATGAFRGGINSGVRGLLESLAQGTGALDTVALGKSLNNQQSNLQQTGSGLRGQLMSQFGINLSNDPQQLISQLNSTDFAAMEFGMDDNTKSTFEDLINSIIENATALQDNTNELAQQNDQSIQDWSSSLWANFRDALFTGNGGILGNIPQAATGAHVLSAGLIKVHEGETVVPAGVTSYQGGGVNITIPIDNRGEGDVDTLALSKRLAFELQTRGR